jgi:hypothetical protein
VVLGASGAVQRALTPSDGALASLEGSSLSRYLRCAASTAVGTFFHPDLRKTGASLDLAIAIGILLGSEQVRAGGTPVGLLGKLGLDGDVRAVPGILPMVAAIAVVAIVVTALRSQPRNPQMLTPKPDPQAGGYWGSDTDTAGAGGT